jgi:cytochrome bd-type quinol oxidase subunit 2
MPSMIRAVLRRSLHDRSLCRVVRRILNDHAQLLFNSSGFRSLGVLIVVVSIIALVSGISAHGETRAFVGSNALLVGLLLAGAAAIYPVILYSNARA